MLACCSRGEIGGSYIVAAMERGKPRSTGFEGELSGLYGMEYAFGTGRLMWIVSSAIANSCKLQQYLERPIEVRYDILGADGADTSST